VGPGARTVEGHFSIFAASFFRSWRGFEEKELHRGELNRRGEGRVHNTFSMKMLANQHHRLGRRWGREAGEAALGREAGKTAVRQNSSLC